MAPRESPEDRKVNAIYNALDARDFKARAVHETGRG